MSSLVENDVSYCLDLHPSYLGDDFHCTQMAAKIEKHCAVILIGQTSEETRFLLAAYHAHCQKNKPLSFFGTASPPSFFRAHKAQGYTTQTITSGWSPGPLGLNMGTQITRHHNAKRKFDPCQRVLQTVENPEDYNGYGTPWKQGEYPGFHWKNNSRNKGPNGFSGMKWDFKKLSQHFNNEKFATTCFLNTDFQISIQVLLQKKTLPAQKNCFEDFINILKSPMGIAHSEDQHSHGMYIVSARPHEFTAGIATSHVLAPSENGDIVEVTHYFSITIKR